MKEVLSLKCAFYEREITPPLGQSMPGYYAKRTATGVADRLYAKAFAAELDNTKIALLVIDCVELPTHYAEKIIKLASLVNDIPEANISVTATHSHTAIPCGEPFVGLEDAEYMDILVRIAADCITIAIKNLQQAEIFYGCGEVHGISFNRNFILKDGRIVTHLSKNDRDGSRPYSDTDPKLPIMTVKNKNGSPLGSIISFACHQDCVGGTEYSGDFSSELALQLKERYGKDFVSIFVAGASADINHVDHYSDSRTLESLPHYRKMGRILAEKAATVMEESQQINIKKLNAYKEFIELKCRQATSEQIKAAQKALDESGGKDWQAALLLDYAKKQKEKVHRTPVQIFKLDEISIVLLPGEMYHQYAEMIRKACPDAKCIFATLANGAHGYIPLPELMDTDIYEAKLCEGSFLEKHAGDKITALAVKMIKRP